MSTGEARRRFAEIIRESAHTVITRHGKDIAAVVPIKDVRQLPPGAIQVLQNHEILIYSGKDGY